MEIYCNVILHSFTTVIAILNTQKVDRRKSGFFKPKNYWERLTVVKSLLIVPATIPVVSLLPNCIFT